MVFQYQEKPNVKKNKNQDNFLNSSRNGEKKIDWGGGNLF